MKAELYPKMVGIREESTRLNIPYDTLRRWCNEGRIAHVRTGARGRKILINEDKLLEYLESAGMN